MVIKITFVTKVLLYRSFKSSKAFVLQWDIEESYIFVNSDVRRKYNDSVNIWNLYCLLNDIEGKTSRTKHICKGKVHCKKKNWDKTKLLGLGLYIDN